MTRWILRFLLLGPLALLAIPDEDPPGGYSKESLPAEWRAAATHMMMSVRFRGEDSRFYVRRGDWNLDGREDIGITMPEYCGNRCCNWYLYVATDSGTYRFLDSFFMSDAPPQFSRNEEGDLEITLPGCGPRGEAQRYVGSEHTGFERVKSGDE